MNRTINREFKDLSGKSFTFEKLSEMHEFAQQEVIFWEEKFDELQAQPNQFHPCFSSHSQFKSLITAIESWQDKLDGWDDTQLQNELKNLQNSIFQHLPKQWLWSGHPYVQPFIEIQKSFGKEGAASFLEFVSNNRVGNLNTVNTFTGAMLAYEFINQDSSITKRRNGEKASLDHLRSQLEEAKTKLLREVEEFKEDFTTWDDSTREQWDNWFSQSKAHHTNAQTTRATNFDDYMGQCQQKILELENTYKNKLRLDSPATYWRKRAKILRWQGGLWVVALTSVVSLAIFHFHQFFVYWLDGKEMGIELSSFQGAIIFAALLSSYAVLIRTLSKLIFSSFHLQRDAEEREQLTHLYLALVQENRIDESSLGMVLQSLFSRSESGLLSGESGPTMPTVGELIKGMKGGQS